MRISITQMLCVMWFVKSAVKCILSSSEIGRGREGGGKEGELRGKGRDGCRERERGG